MPQIHDELREFIVDNFLFGKQTDLDDDTSFMDNGIIDSTGVLELIGFVEETYCVKIEDHELIPENLDNIRNLSTLINSKLDSGAGAVSAT